MKLFTLAGRIDDEDYQKSYECIQYLRTDRPSEFQFTILEMFPVEWEGYLHSLRERAALPMEVRCVVHTEDMKTLYRGAEFVDHVISFTNFKIFDYPVDSDDAKPYGNQAKIRYKQFLKRTGHAFCFLELSISGLPLEERVVLELFIDLCPHTCYNFLHLCVGDMGEVEATTTAGSGGPKGKSCKLHYKNTNFFRIVKEGWIQGGDIVDNMGTGGHSVYGSVFPDECFTVKHSREGVLGMANNGKDSNASQFYVTVAQNSWMDGKYVAFGRVVEGLSIIHRIHSLATHPDQRPMSEVVITDCGQIPLNRF
jgi:peptidylprolyl isomerase